MNGRVRLRRVLARLRDPAVDVAIVLAATTGLVAIYAAAVAFGLSHPASNAWALPILLLVLAVLGVVALIHAASLAPYDHHAPPSHLDLAHREAADHARAKRH